MIHTSDHCPGSRYLMKGVPFAVILAGLMSAQMSAQHKNTVSSPALVESGPSRSIRTIDVKSSTAKERLLPHERRAGKNIAKRAARSGASVRVATEDSLALVALYYATFGASWSDNSGWLSSPLSDWYGVVLNKEGHVLEVDLHENGLSGALPSQLGDLKSLKALYLSYNNLHGELPEALFSLTALESIDLGKF